MASCQHGRFARDSLQRLPLHPVSCVKFLGSKTVHHFGQTIWPINYSATVASSLASITWELIQTLSEIRVVTFLRITADKQVDTRLCALNQLTRRAS